MIPADYRRLSRVHGYRMLIRAAAWWVLGARGFASHAHTHPIRNALLILMRPPVRGG
jgi:hypothetical protein